jgi:hypothetical protein
MESQQQPPFALAQKQNKESFQGKIALSKLYFFGLPEAATVLKYALLIYTFKHLANFDLSLRVHLLNLNIFGASVILEPDVKNLYTYGVFAQFKS